MMPDMQKKTLLTAGIGRKLQNRTHTNSITFYLYSAITIQLSLGALQSPEPEPP